MLFLFPVIPAHAGIQFSDWRVKTKMDAGFTDMTDLPSARAARFGFIDGFAPTRKKRRNKAMLVRRFDGEARQRHRHR